MDWFKNNVPNEISEILLKLRITASDKTVIERDFRPDVDISYDEYETQLEDTPSILAFWSAVLSEQKANVDTLKFKLERRKSAVASRNREIANANNIKITQDAIKDLVIQDEQVMKLTAELILAERNTSKLFGVIQSIQCRADNLRSLAGFKKRELERP